MIITTTDSIEGKPTVEVLGMVKGSTIRARHVGRDFMAGIRNLIGGEVTEYTTLLAQSREEAVIRMVGRAEDLGANAVVGTRFMTSMVMGGAVEMLAYGTAVIVKECED